MNRIYSFVFKYWIYRYQFSIECSCWSFVISGLPRIEKLKIYYCPMFCYVQLYSFKCDRLHGIPCGKINFQPNRRKHIFLLTSTNINCMKTCTKTARRMRVRKNHTYTHTQSTKIHSSMFDVSEIIKNEWCVSACVCLHVHRCSKWFTQYVVHVKNYDWLLSLHISHPSWCSFFGPHPAQSLSIQFRFHCIHYTCVQVCYVRVLVLLVFGEDHYPTLILIVNDKYYEIFIDFWALIFPSDVEFI